MMLRILEPTFFLLIVIAHHPLNTFGGTIHEESSTRHLSEAVQKLQNEIELLKKDNENIRRLCEDKENFPVSVEPEQSKFDNFLTDEGSQRENISTLNDISNEDNVLPTLQGIQDQISKLQTWLSEILVSNVNAEIPTDSRNYDKHFNCIRNCSSTESVSKSCSQVTSANNFNDGVYLLKGPKPDSKPFYVFCIQMDGIGKNWMVIQRREDGSVNFNRNWLDYKLGFGDLLGEYWIGLERLHQITNSKPHELLIILVDFETKTHYAEYSQFGVGSEDECYKLTVGNYSGNAGDSLRIHNSTKFSTFDNDNDGSHRNYARHFKGGWWHNDWNASNLNGLYYSKMNSIAAINWNRFSGNDLQFAMMAIRPK